ncbi:putative transcriptional regulator, TetR family [Gordonia polyisoprenivorans VH2]|uniref:Putative transcriptional regulator, TetR family n=1 Tax=Gordonia polyisoprenivorans (strain DSM 44266 / VH2) TaxID=1112204 RepID=H6MZI0_GORPV|nr:TetR family transcriptional regulator [Gordonia polyisoprenivorans]AFA71967.1 putative transcriptional regulator, TetR family [Gordonia polyisoprenivorans VH2]
MVEHSPSGRHPGARIRSARMTSGVSLREFSRRIGISPATLSATENERTGISVERLETIAAALGIHPSTLLEDGPPPAFDEPANTDDDAGTSRAWRDFGGAEVADPVLDAALSCIVAKGYHGCSIRDIADAAGLSVASLYHHHESKQAMLVDLFDQTMTELLDRAAGARDDAGGDPVRAFTLMVESLVLYHSYRRRLSFLGATEMRSLVEPNRRRIADRRVALQRMFDTEIDRAAAQGRFGAPRPRDASRAVVGLCIGVADWYDPDGPDTPERIAALYTRYALNLVGARP